MTPFPHRLSVISFILALVALCIAQVAGFAVKVNIDNSSLSSLTSYQTDLASCNCNLHESICDNFCCCDTTCPSSQTSAWSAGGLCRNTNSNLEQQCDSLSSGNFKSFQNLACVYYSNRGNIGYFYNYPQTGSITYPPSNKFVPFYTTSTSIDSISTSAGAALYSSSQSFLKINSTVGIKYLEVWSPIGGGNCGISFVNISKSTSYSCDYALSAQTCLLSTQYLQGAIGLCKTGDCASNQLLSSIAASVVSVSGNLCNNMITSQTITITLSSSGSVYTISSIGITFTQQNISISANNVFSISTNIIVNKPASSVSYSGNPGYFVGNSIIFSSSGSALNLYNIADSSGNCISTGATPISVIFDQNVVYSCASSNPCASSLYIDSITKTSSLEIQKWAKNSNTTIVFSGTGSSVNTCSSQTVNLNIIYSNAGWVLDVQNYVIGASVTTQAAVQSSWSRKYLKINWIYVDSSTITNPPSNYFYQYFSYLWKPLNQYLGVTES